MIMSDMTFNDLAEDVMTDDESDDSTDDGSDITELVKYLDKQGHLEQLKMAYMKQQGLDVGDTPNKSPPSTREAKQPQNSTQNQSGLELNASTLYFTAVKVDENSDQIPALSDNPTLKELAGLIEQQPELTEEMISNFEGEYREWQKQQQQANAGGDNE